MKPQELTLPEFAFLDGSEHEDNILKKRTVFQHIRSYTVFELFDKQDAVILNTNVKKYEFEHINIYGVTEELILVIHFTFAPDEDIIAIFQKAADWYRAYCRWEDRNIEEDGGPF